MWFTVFISSSNSSVIILLCTRLGGFWNMLLIMVWVIIDVLLLRTKRMLIDDGWR